MRAGPRRNHEATRSGANGIAEIVRRNGKCERILARAIAAGGDASFILDTNLRVRSWSVSAQQFYGYSAEEITGQTSEILRLRHVNLALLDHRNGCLQRLFSGSSEREQLETRHVHRDGAVINAQVVLTPLCNDAGEVIGLVVASRDVTRRWADPRLRSPETFSAARP